MARDPQALITEFTALTQRKATVALKPNEQQRLDLLRDVLLELGALPSKGDSHPVRPVRAEVVLDVTFSTRDEVVRAYTKDISTGGLAIKTDRNLPVGSPVDLRVKLPGTDEPLMIAGKVAWCSAGALGVAFGELTTPAEQKLKDLLVQNVSVLKRIQTVLTTDVRKLATRPAAEAAPPVEAVAPVAATAAVPPPAAVKPVEADNRPAVLVHLSDPKFVAVVTEVLEQKGLRHVAAGTAVRPAVLVVDSGTAVEMATAHNRALVVMVNVSGPDALFGKLALIKTTAYVKRPATAAQILEAVEPLLAPSST